MARRLRDTFNRGEARRALRQRLQRDEMGEEAYRKSLAPNDPLVKIVFLLMVLIAGAIMFMLP